MEKRVEILIIGYKLVYLISVIHFHCVAICQRIATHFGRTTHQFKDKYQWNIIKPNLQPAMTRIMTLRASWTRRPNNHCFDQARSLLPINSSDSYFSQTYHQPHSTIDMSPISTKNNNNFKIKSPNKVFKCGINFSKNHNLVQQAHSGISVLHQPPWFRTSYENNLRKDNTMLATNGRHRSPLISFPI